MGAANVECCAEEHPAPPGGLTTPLSQRGLLTVPRVRSYVRKDGVVVRAHNRKARPRTAAPVTTPRRRTTAPRRRPVRHIPAGTPTAYVRPHYRADGTRVRGHRRIITPLTAVAAAGAGTTFFIILLVLIALSGHH